MTFFWYDESSSALRLFYHTLGLETFVDLREIYLQCHKDSMCLTDYPHNYRALFYRFLCILDLKYSALWRTMGLMSELLHRKQRELYSQSHRVIIIVVSEHFKSSGAFRLVFKLVQGMCSKGNGSHQAR